MKGKISSMTALLLDTSGKTAFIALSKEGMLLHLQILPDAKQLSKFLLPSIDTLLQGRPDYIAIGVGPGSYTGTRIGGMVAKTLAFAWKIPLISFSSSLLPHVESIAKLSYEKYLSKEETKLDLVYFSSTP
jgi:tRNA threonylcarbamoyl adenosine modification protein YeaZ